MFLLKNAVRVFLLLLFPPQVYHERNVNFNENENDDFHKKNRSKKSLVVTSVDKIKEQQEK